MNELALFAGNGNPTQLAYLPPDKITDFLEIVE